MSESKKNILSFSHVCIIFALMIGFRFLPPIGAITPLGMEILGIFLGTLYGWSTMGMVWPSLLSMAFLSLLPETSAIETFKAGFGDRITIAIFFFLLFGELINKVGLSRYIANWCITRKFVQGKPYVLLLMFCVAGFLVSACVNTFAGIILMWSVFFSFCKQVGIKPGDPFALLSLMSIIYICSMAGNLLPFMGTSILVAGLQENLLGIPLPYFNFTFIQLIMLLIAGVIYFGIVRFVFKPNVDIVKNYVPPSAIPKMTGQQKFVFFLLFMLLLLLFIPGLLPAELTITKSLKALDIAGVIAIIFVVYYIVNLKNKEVIPFTEIAKEVNWNLILMFATIAPLTAAISNEDAGILSSVNQLLDRVVGDMSPVVFAITVLLFASVITQFCNNVAILLLVLPIMYTFAIQLGANPVALSILANFNLNIAFCTPAASGQAAMVFSNKRWIDTKSAYMHGFIIFAINMIVTVIGLFIANALL